MSSAPSSKRKLPCVQQPGAASARKGRWLGSEMHFSSEGATEGLFAPL